MKEKFLILIIVLIIFLIFWIYPGTLGDKVEFILTNPLIIGVLLIFIGKFTIVDKILIRRSLDVKFNSINKINAIRNKLKEANFFYDRYINSLKLIKDTTSKEEIEQKMKGLEKELDGIGRRLFEDIPLLFSHFETELELYFKDKRELETLFDQYREGIFTFINFYAELPQKTQNADLFKKSNEYTELNLDNIKETENILIEKLKKAKTIFD